MYAKIEQPVLNRFLIDQLSCFVSQIPSRRSLLVKAQATEEKAKATVKQQIEPNKNGGVRRKLLLVRAVVVGWYVQQPLQEVNLERRSIQHQEQQRLVGRRRGGRKEAGHNELHQQHQQRQRRRRRRPRRRRCSSSVGGGSRRLSGEGARCSRRNCSPTSSRRRC